MNSVAIGVALDSDGELLTATLAALQHHTPDAASVVLLTDAFDPETRKRLASFPDLPQLICGESQGLPCMFNRLLLATRERVVVFLRNGALACPGWLDRLLAGLAADPHHGLAGPSTNLAWNAQGVFPRSGSSPDEIARNAEAVARRFGDQCRTLEPLYSLADFCYAVRREVFEDIGPADEGYGRGPCWEMDYNIRAARAGWRGVWVPGAYVHRLPLPERRRLDERRLFEASKQRYQDKFCGGRLRGEKPGYRSHCRGDTCPNFAPVAFASRWRPEGVATLSDLGTTAVTAATSTGSTFTPSLSPSLSRPKGEGGRTLTPSLSHPMGEGGQTLTPSLSHPMGEGARRAGEGGFMASTYADPPSLPAPQEPAPCRSLVTDARVVSEPPLVTCLLPTYNRRAFIPAAVARFLRQDYPQRELLILDDGTDPIHDCLPADPRVRYLRLPEKLILGAKRNLGCAEARGAFIAHWDDDDWYPPDRLRRQMQALEAPGIEVCGTSHLFYYDGSRQLAWRYRYGPNGRPWVAGNTLAYRRSFWERHPFPTVQVGEDTRFVWSAEPRTVRDLADPSLCVACVHTGNTSRKQTRGAYWSEIPTAEIQRLLGEVFARFGAAPEASSAPSPAPDRGGPEQLPLVSCIMPTANRRAFLPLALESYQRQDYPNRELVVVDDGAEPVGDLVSGLPGVHYVHLTQRLSIGAKRNLAVQHSHGDLIAHWDDDDWYAPDRLRYQVMPILENRADLTGLENAFTLELPSGQFWTVDAELHRRLFVGDVHGGTLVYRRQLFLEGLRYPEVNLAEDAGLIRAAVGCGKRLLRLGNPAVFIYVRHGRNAWRQYAPGRFLQPEGWKPVTAPVGFFASDLERYRTAASASPGCW